MRRSWLRVERERGGETGLHISQKSKKKRKDLGRIFPPERKRDQHLGNYEVVGLTGRKKRTNSYGTRGEEKGDTCGNSREEEKKGQ